MSAKLTVFAMKCPNCGASIEASEGQTMLTCEYCNNTLHLGERKSEPPPAVKPSSPPPSTQPPPYRADPDIIKAREKLQKQAMKAAKSATSVAAIIGVIVPIVIVGGIISFSVFMAQKTHKTAQQRSQDIQQNVQNRIKNEKLERERKEWARFRESNGEPLNAKMKKALQELLKEIKMPHYGKATAKFTVIEFANFTSTGMHRQKEMAKVRRRLFIHHGEKFHWIFIPVPAEDPLKSSHITFLFEFYNKKGIEGLDTFMRRLHRNNRWTWDNKDAIKQAVAKGMDKKTAESLYKDKEAHAVLKKIFKVNETLDLPQNESSLVINDYVYKGYQVISRFPYILENEFGLKK
ncbi:hypothetical protein KKF34_16955 [Myxococcota bacterium]|nr:hypothetical protein [Myxococcota bacterium]MBU1379931.1 hypothetical protein [Myxococcota bacterium]MBU1498569.1 hypothetical protein [Myxococcota bacterium]